MHPLSQPHSAFVYPSRQHNPSVWPWLLGAGLLATAGGLLWWHGKKALAARMNHSTTITTGEHLVPRVVDITSPQEAMTLVGNKNESLVALMYCSSSLGGKSARQFLDVVSGQPENAGITFYAVDVNAVMPTQASTQCKSTDATLAVQRAIPQGAQVKLEIVNAATDPKLVAWTSKGAPAEEAILHAVRWVKGEDGPAPSQTFTRAA